jgi:hypothetical protein
MQWGFLVKGVKAIESFNLGTYLNLESEPSYVKNGVEEVV